MNSKQRKRIKRSAGTVWTRWTLVDGMDNVDGSDGANNKRSPRWENKATITERHYMNQEKDMLVALAEELATRMERHFKVLPCVTLGEAAKEIGCHPQTIKKAIEAGELKAIKFCKEYKIPVIELNKFLESKFV